MKISKKIFSGMAGLVLLFGMMIVGCGDGNNGITITGINGKSGKVSIYLHKQYLTGTDYFANTSTRTISGNSVTFEESWSSGSYYVELVFAENDGPYFYTNGKTLDGLNISSGTPRYSNTSLYNLPKYNVPSKPSTISFSKFQFYSQR